MATHQSFLIVLAVFVGATLAGPLQSRESKACRSVCPVSDIQKLSFTEGKSYVYKYKGRSETKMENVDIDAGSAFDLEADVTLSFVTPCQMSIAITNPLVNGQEDEIMKELLTKKTMMADMKDNIVTGVCADPEDHPTGLNLKKGIVSSLQNVLPVISPHIKNVTLEETDIIGRCPTNYRVVFTVPNMQVIKFKDHKRCSDQYSTADESPAASWWLNSPLSMINESWSECIQMIDQSDRTIVYVTCKDVKNAKLPPISSLKLTQTSTLKLIKVVDGITVPSLMKWRHTNLTFEVVPQPKSQQLVSVVKDHLKELCEKVEPKVQKGASKVYEKVIGYMYRIPEQSVKEILKEIRNGKFCKKHERLESLYLDAVAFVDNGGAVELMVDEVLSGKISGGRTPLYTMALFLTKKPCIHSVKAVSRLFDSDKASSSMVLAAGSLVRKYCRFHEDCRKEEPVKEILDKLSKTIDSSCSLTSNNQEKKTRVLTTLKAIGNIANITHPLGKTILKCIEAKRADTFVRVAAAQSLRHASCHCQPTSDLVRVATTKNENPEVRIASYIAAVRCASFEEDEEILSKISSESNTQVRAFVLSHLRNLQKSDAPFMRGIRYNLSSLVIPNDYERDVRKYSRNVDISYYLPTLGLGAAADTSLVYAPGSYIPRQLQYNFTVDLFDNVINVGEFAVRVEDLENILNVVFGPEGYFKATPNSQMAKDILEEIKNKGSKVRKHLEKILKDIDGKSSSLSDVSEILNVFTSESKMSNLPKLDAFARIFGQEVAFTSFALDTKNMNGDQALKKCMEAIGKLAVDVSATDLKAARGVQFNSEHFAATAQGIPVQFKRVYTIITAFDNPQKPSKSKMDMSPALSLAVNLFTGYSIGVKAGFRGRSEIYGSPQITQKVDLHEGKLEAVFDMPANIPLVRANYSGITMLKMPAKEDIKTAPNKAYPVRHKRECLPPPEDHLGVKMCYEAQYPDYDQVKLFPLGEIRFDLNTSKVNPKKKVLKVTALVSVEDKVKGVELQIEAPGASTPKMCEAQLEYKREKGVTSLKAYGKGPKGKERVMQVNVKQKSSSSTSVSNVVLFYGKQKVVSTSDQILVVRMKEEESNAQFEREFDLRTKKALAKYIDADVQIDLVSKMSSPKGGKTKSVDVRKFEFNVNIPSVVNTTNYIRKVESSRKANFDYDIFSLTKSPSEELLKVVGRTNSSGEFASMTHQCYTHLSVKFPECELEYQSKMALTRQRKEATVSLRRVDKNLHYLLANVSMTKETPTSSLYATKAEIKMPSLIPSYKIDGSIDEKTASQYTINLVAKKDNEPMYNIEGPLNVDWSRSNFKERSQLKLKSLKESKEYLIKTSLQLSPLKRNAMVDLKMNGVPVFTVEGELEREGSVVSSGVGLTLPKLIDAKLKGEMSMNTFHVFLNGYLKPNTFESQRLKGSSSVDISKKEIRAELAYDADKDPSKKVQTTAFYDFSFARKYAGVRGDLEISSRKYSYSGETKLGAYSVDPNSKNSIRLMVRKPNGEEAIVESQCSVKREGSAKELHVLSLVQSSPKHSHRVESRYKYDFSSAPLKMYLKGNTQMESPLVKKIDIMLDSEVDISDRRQSGHCKMEIAGANRKSPIMSSVEIANEEKSLNAKAKLDLGSESSVKMNGVAKLTRNERNSVEDASMDLSLMLSKDRDYKIMADKSKQLVDLSLTIDGRKVLALEHSCPKPGEWWAKLTTPLRIVETHSNISQNSISMSLYPNRRQSDKKYEVKGYYNKLNSYTGSRLEGGAHLIHPYSPNKITIRTDVAMKESSSHGVLELDIFNRPEEKIIVDVQTSKEEEKSFTMKADVKVPNQEIVPQIFVRMALSKEVNIIEMSMKKSPEVEPSYSSLISFNHPVKKSTNLFMLLQTPSEQITMMSNIHLHEILQCRGKTANGTIVSRNHGTYNFVTAFCAPAYLEIGAKKASEDKIYIAKVGMKSPSSMKVALDMVYNSTDAITKESVRNIESTMNLYGRHEYLPKINVLLVGAKLWSSKMVTLDAHYNSTGVNDYMDNVAKPGFKALKKISREISAEMRREMREKFFSQVPDVSVDLRKEISKVSDKLSEEISAISKELKVNLPSWEEVKDTLESIKRRSSEAYEEAKQNLDAALENAFGVKLIDIHRKLKEVDRQIQKAMVYIYKECQQLWLAVSSGRETMIEIPSLKVLIEKLEGSSIFNWFKKQLEKLKHLFQREWEAITHFLKHWVTVVKNEMKNIFHKVVNSTFFKKIIKWIESFLSTEVSEEDSSLVALVGKKLYSFYLTPKEGLIRLQMPLRRPVSSLPAAVMSIGVPLPLKSMKSITDPSHALRSIIHPHSSSATLDKDKVVTFDGLVIPMIHSDCEILMAKVYGDKVIAKVAEDRKMDVVVQLKNGRKLDIHIEGQQLRVPSMQNKQTIKSIPLNVTKSSRTIEIQLKGMNVRVDVNRVEVLAKPWSFSKVAGLMGTNDHEISSDAHSKAKINYKPNSLDGQHHATVETARNMLEKYRVRKTCTIPRS